MSLKLLINGSKGRMGRAIAEAADAAGVDWIGCDIGDDAKEALKSCGVAVDFSFRDATAPLAKLCAESGKPLVIGTTGHSAEQRSEIEACAKSIPIVWAGNYSLGVNLLNYLVKTAAEILDESYDAEIVEMHHRHKKDAPSGTAEKLKEIILKARGIGEESVCYGRKGMVGERKTGEVGVHSVRGGSVVGDHTVIFAAEGERVELVHKAADRAIFARGAVKAASWVVGKPAGIYGMEDVLSLR